MCTVGGQKNALRPLQRGSSLLGMKKTSVQDRTDPVFCSADLPLFPIYFSNTCSKSDAMCSDIKQLLAFFLRYNNSKL